MIIGRGLLGRSLPQIDGDQFLFYANGISNSVLDEIPPDNFELNEIKEIASENPGKVFVYFSTCQLNSVHNHQRPYVQHKLLVEAYIKERFERYLVVRASNLVGYNPWNSHTLFNYLYHAITTKTQILVNPGLYRNFLDVSHFVELLRIYLKRYSGNDTIEIVNPFSYRMDEIVSEFEKFLSEAFSIKEVTAVNDFAVFDLDDRLSIELFRQCGISTKDYIPFLLKKYYPVPALKPR